MRGDADTGARKMSAVKRRIFGATIKTLGIIALSAVATGCPPEQPPENSANEPGDPKIEVPAVPSGLTTTPENGQITIVWDASARATSYDIFRVMGMDGAIGEDAEPRETIPAGSERARRYVDGGLTKGAVYGYAIAAINGAGSSGLSDIVYEEAAEIVDIDGDGLIEIGSLERLDAIRYDLEGVSYKASMSDTGNSRGCPEMGGCNGYELTRSLDFDEEASYASGMVNEAWRPNADDPGMATNPGWIPIGACDDADNILDETRRCGIMETNGPLFSAVFEGNTHTITGLYTRGSGEIAEIGLFGAIDDAATIRNLGVINGNIYGGARNRINKIIIIGGLVGFNSGTIIASYASGNVDGNVSAAGGLVGVNRLRGNIIASYATGNVGSSRSAGGLVGLNGAIIDSSYATGSVRLKDEAMGDIGGLVGINSTLGLVFASYATGDVDGDGLVGTEFSATGRISESYGFGALMEGETINTESSTPDSITDAAALTAENAGANWDGGMGAWDFGDHTQAPALRYADYVDVDYDCVDTLADGSPLICGETLIPGQRESSPVDGEALVRAADPAPKNRR